MQLLLTALIFVNCKCMMFDYYRWSRNSRRDNNFKTVQRQSGSADFEGTLSNDACLITLNSKPMMATHIFILS